MMDLNCRSLRVENSGTNRSISTDFAADFFDLAICALSRRSAYEDWSMPRRLREGPHVHIHDQIWGFVSSSSRWTNTSAPISANTERASCAALVPASVLGNKNAQVICSLVAR